MLRRGMAFLDSGYDKDIKKFQSIYQNDLEIGQIIGINDAKIGQRGNYYVRKYDIISSGAKLYQEIEAEKCKIQ